MARAGDRVLTVAKLVGMDVSPSVIGMALSDGSWSVARALDTIITRRREPEEVREDIEKICRDNEVGGIVVGYPLCAATNEPTEQCARVVRYMSKLQLEVPMTLWDERYTTAIAEASYYAREHERREMLRRAGRRKKAFRPPPPLDDEAARTMLTDFLERCDDPPPYLP